MKTLLKTEELFQLLLCIFLNTFLPFSWWWYWVWFLSPDLSFVGYAINTKVGAFAYNVAHHKGVGITLYIIGIYMTVPELQFAGLVLFGHSAFDRMLGYGLKYEDDFKHTHLGWIGEKSTNNQIPNSK
jgi:hypothetical protein